MDGMNVYKSIAVQCEYQYCVQSDYVYCNVSIRQLNICFYVRVFSCSLRFEMMLMQ